MNIVKILMMEESYIVLARWKDLPVEDSCPMEEDKKQLVLLAITETSIVERLVAERAVGRFEGLASLARELGVPPDCIGLHSSLSELTRSAVASVLNPGDVLALAEPCRESWLLGALECGGRFLDVGRDHTLIPMETALSRALQDGLVHGVLIEHPAVVGGGTLDLPDEYAPFIFVDQSASVMPEVAVDSGVLHLGQTGGVAWVVGTPERLAKITLHLEATGRDDDALAEVETMAQAIESAGLLLHQPGGVALWARRPGVLGADLESALLNGGVDARRRAHPCWREGVALAPPVRAELDSWAQSVQAALSSLPDTE